MFLSENLPNHKISSFLIKKSKSKFTRNNLFPIKLLIVEDTPICQKLASIMFKAPDYLIDIVALGHEALAMYQHDYDVILLDLGLPDISGIDVCQRIRAENNTLPIIAYSAMGDSLKQQCLKAGFSQALTKPCAQEVLDTVIKTLVHDYHQVHNYRQTNN